MAEIKIQKKRTPVWAWLLGLVALVLVALFFLYPDNDVDDTNVAVADEYYDTNSTTNTTAIPSEVTAFVAYANENPNYTVGEMGIHHDYTAGAIRSMADAIVALANRRNLASEMNVLQIHNTLDTKANQIQKDWRSTDHADVIRSAFLDVSNALDRLANSTSNVDLQKEARDIDPNTLTLDQREDVKDFIDKTATVMQKIASEK